MVEINDLLVQFGGVKPIGGLTAKLDAPVMGLIGPNGAGNTTLLNVFSGFVTPKHGSVKVRGLELLGVPPHRRANLGLRRTFQTDQIAEDLTLWDNVLVMADHSKHEESSQLGVARAIKYVGLLHLASRRGEQLTTYQRHLAEIAKTLVGQPTLVLMDEPGAGLSELESAHLQKIIIGLPRFCGAQVLLIDHDVALIAACCSSTMVLDFGKLLACGPTKDVMELPEVRRAYLGESLEQLEKTLEQAF